MPRADTQVAADLRDTPRGCSLSDASAFTLRHMIRVWFRVPSLVAHVSSPAL